MTAAWPGRGWFDPPGGDAGATDTPPGSTSKGPERSSSEPDPVERAHAAALRLLTVRAHSRAEIDQRLRRRGFNAEAVTEALDRLERAGLLDDAAFAAELAASRIRRGYAASVVTRDLRTRGVDRDLADQAAVAASPPDAEAERCRAIATDWLARHRGLEPDVAARRLAGFLARRGYPSSMVAEAVRRALDRDFPGADQ